MHLFHLCNMESVAWEWLKTTQPDKRNTHGYKHRSQTRRPQSVPVQRLANHFTVFNEWKWEPSLIKENISHETVGVFGLCNAIRKTFFLFKNVSGAFPVQNLPIMFKSLNMALNMCMNVYVFSFWVNHTTDYLSNITSLLNRLKDVRYIIYCV